MNMTKNGIPIYVKPSQKFGTPHRHVPNPYTLFVTLKRMEDFTKVWLVMPFIKREVNQLEKEGWKVEEIWERK